MRLILGHKPTEDNAFVAINLKVEITLMLQQGAQLDRFPMCILVGRLNRKHHVLLKQMTLVADDNCEPIRGSPIADVYIISKALTDRNRCIALL